MTAPNLFALATSELSQDAFLCWLVANASNTESEALRRVGQNFIAWLWHPAHPGEPSPDASSVTLVAGPVRQHQHIDILFTADVGGVPRVFVIEDKTDTSHHADQLERYAKATGVAGRDSALMYFKTGFHFGEDRAAADHKYTVVGLAAFVAFLRAQEVVNDIFREYRVWAERLLAERESALVEVMTPAGWRLLGQAFIQWTVMEQISERCWVQAGHVHRGVNIGGTRWTQLKIGTFTARLRGDIEERLFHRIDWRNDDRGTRRPYLSTRQWAVVKENAHARKQKVAHLGELRRAFEAAARASATGLVFGRPSADHRGANESEIGTLFFDEGTNSTTNVIEQFGAVHAAFVTALGEGFRRT